MYWKTNTNFNPGGVSVNGFGFNHDGAVNGLVNQANQKTFGTVFQNPAEEEALEAYELCFDTGTPPATGYSRTLTSATVSTVAAQSDWSTLQTLAAASTIDLIANGTVQGSVTALLYQPSTGSYSTTTPGVGPFSEAQLTTFIKSGDTLTIMGVPFGSGSRMASQKNVRLASAKGPKKP